MSHTASSTAARLPNRASSRVSRRARPLRLCLLPILSDAAAILAAVATQGYVPLRSTTPCSAPAANIATARSTATTQPTRPQPDTQGGSQTAHPLYLSTDARSVNSVPPLVNIQPAQVVNIQPAPTTSLHHSRGDSLSKATFAETPKYIKCRHQMLCVPLLTALHKSRAHSLP